MRSHTRFAVELMHFTDDKPSIYDPPTQTRVLVRDDSTPLETTIRDTRRQVLHAYYSTKNTILDGVNKWIGVERQVERTLQEIAPKGEETLLPGAIYVGIAGMGGSILARNRIIHQRMYSDSRNVSNTVSVTVNSDGSGGLLFPS